MEGVADVRFGGRNEEFADGDDGFYGGRPVRWFSEGVVIRSSPLLRDVFGQWLIIKHKSEKFAEVAKKDPSKAMNTAPAQSFAEMFVVEGRIANPGLRLGSGPIELPLRHGRDQVSGHGLCP